MKMETKIKNLYKQYLRDNQAIRVEEGIVIIPDISGYTKFVNSICIEAGRYITRELLCVILQANEIGMEVSEIEGDAILFYKFGEKPSTDTIIGQYESMLKSFNIKLKEIETIVGYKLDLSLKLIAHYGTFSEYTIGKFKKLYGEPIVKAHSLLKNSIKSNTYVLMTKSLASEHVQEKNADYFVVNYQLQRQIFQNN